MLLINQTSGLNIKYLPFYLNDPNDRKVPKISVAVYSPNKKHFFFKKWILKSSHFNPASNINTTSIFEVSVYETLVCDQWRPFKWNLLSGGVMLYVFQYHIKWIWATGRRLKSTKLSIPSAGGCKENKFLTNSILGLLSTKKSWCRSRHDGRSVWWLELALIDPC